MRCGRVPEDLDHAVSASAPASVSVSEWTILNAVRNPGTETGTGTSTPCAVAPLAQGRLLGHGSGRDAEAAGEAGKTEARASSPISGNGSETGTESEPGSGMGRAGGFAILTTFVRLATCRA